jgi:hypothetical protein
LGTNNSNLDEILNRSNEDITNEAKTDLLIIETENQNYNRTGNLEIILEQKDENRSIDKTECPDDPDATKMVQHQIHYKM